MAPGFDWSLDLIKAELINESYLDRVRSRTLYNESLENRWESWLTATREYLAGISLEGLRSIVLIHGATILATLTIVSGQITAAAPNVVVAARAMFIFSLAGLAAGSVGYAVIYALLQEAADRIESRLVRPMKHLRYRSLYRYRSRYYVRKGKTAEFLIYGSIGSFVVGSLVTGLILVFG